MAPHAASSSSHAPPPLVNTIVGTRRPDGPRAQRGEHRAHRGQRKRAERVGGQQAAPRVEDHHGVRPGRDLLVEIGGDRVRIDSDETGEQIRPRVRHRSHRREIRAAATLDHVARERERAAGEADQRNAPLECALDARAPRRTHRRGVPCRARRAPGSTLRPPSCARSADPRLRRSRDRGPSRRAPSGCRRTGSPHRAGIARAAAASPRSRASGDLREREKAARLRARRVVLGQIASGLAHQPHRRPRRRLAAERAQEGVVVEFRHRGRVAARRGRGQAPRGEPLAAFSGPRPARGRSGVRGSRAATRSGSYQRGERQMDRLLEHVLARDRGVHHLIGEAESTWCRARTLQPPARSRAGTRDPPSRGRGARASDDRTRCGAPWSRGERRAAIDVPGKRRRDPRQQASSPSPRTARRRARRAAPSGDVREHAQDALAVVRPRRKRVDVQPRIVLAPRHGAADRGLRPVARPRALDVGRVAGKSALTRSAACAAKRAIIAASSARSAALPVRALERVALEADVLRAAVRPLRRQEASLALGQREAEIAAARARRRLRVARASSRCASGCEGRAPVREWRA